MHWSIWAACSAFGCVLLRRVDFVNFEPCGGLDWSEGLLRQPFNYIKCQVCIFFKRKSRFWSKSRCNFLIPLIQSARSSSDFAENISGSGDVPVSISKQCSPPLGGFFTTSTFESIVGSNASIPSDTFKVLNSSRPTLVKTQKWSFHFLLFSNFFRL